MELKPKVTEGSAGIGCEDITVVAPCVTLPNTDRSEHRMIPLANIPVLYLS